jgi:hypothetical protein
MARRIFGKIRDTYHGGIPVKGLKVKAWDEDPLTGDDFMGEKISNTDGKYQIKYSDMFWDKRIPSLSSYLPDIYITLEIRNKAGKWVRLWRSQVFHDHDLRSDLRIDFDVRLEPVVKVMTKFDPEKHAYKFRNGFLFNPSVIGLDFKEMGMGFCGGMCGAALNRFKRGEMITPASDKPQQGSRLYEELFKRQVKSLSPVVLAKMLSFQAAPNQVDAFRKESIGELAKKEWPKLKAELDKNRPTMLVLIRAKRLFDNPTKNHQVLAVGYEYDPPRGDLTIFEYDPNEKNKMMTLEMNLALPDGKLYFKDGSHRGTRGFFVSDAGSAASRKMRI